MPSPWTLAELTEFDLRLRPAADPEPDVTLDLPDPAARTDVLQTWLHASRATDPEAGRLAALAVRGEIWFRLALLIFSLLAGMGAAAGLLRYGGERLINVGAYLGVLVGGQLLLVLVTLVSGVWLRNRMSFRENLLLPRAVRDLPAPQSLKAWRWRLFTSFQLGGVSFNLGVLAATLWKVAAFDLAFGWATTLDVSPETVPSAVHALARPWGGAFTPGPEEIAHSRIVMLEGFTRLDPDSTAAWWPFLMLSVACYGLLPRLLLALTGRLRLRQLTTRPDLDAPESEHLYQRLTRRPLRFSTDTAGGRTDGLAPAPALAALAPAGPLRLRMSEDLTTSASGESLRGAIEKRLQVALSDDPDAGVLQVIEAWQPPLEETLRELRELRTALGPGRDLILLALGLPGPDGGFRAPRTEDLAVWERRLSELHDPRLGLVPWPEERP